MHAAALMRSSAKISSSAQWEIRCLQGYAWPLSRELSTGDDGILHDVHSHPLGIKCRRPNSFQADQIQIAGTASVQPLPSWAALSSAASKIKQKTAPLEYTVIYSGNSIYIFRRRVSPLN